MQELIKLTESTRLTTNDKGVTKIVPKDGFLKAGEFKENYKQKYPESTAKERSRAFERYVRETSVDMAQTLDTAKLISLIEQRKIGIKRLAKNKKGTELTTVFIDLSNTARPQEIIAQTEGMEEKDLRDLVQYLQEKLAKEVKTASVDFQNLLNS